ncbi:MAG: hypothetical protein JKY96_02255 [Phycisphaerales bacterium]|nr:hypothetical protein [Phycisphaerales bacterium]
MSTPSGIDGPSKARAILARVFGEGENPLAWGLPIGRVMGVRVRVHLVFILFVLGVLIFTLPGNQMGVVFVLPMLVALCVLVLAHELGHVIVCKRLGGTVDEIMLWPLGGLLETNPPHTPGAMIRTALGGVMVNAILVPVFGGLVFVLSGSLEALVFNPLSIASQIGEIQLRGGSSPWWFVGIWSFHVVNLLILGANLLLPMFPLDAGQILQGVLWKSRGSTRALWIAVHVGLAVAAGLAFVGVMMGDGKVLLALGVFGGLVCVGKRRQLQFLQYAEMIPGYQADLPVDVPVGGEESGEDVDSTVDTTEVDRILAKISSQGIGAISKSERRMLKQATEISRKSEDGEQFSE